VFFGLFSLPQNLKMASCKGYRLLGRPKKAKKNVVIAVFLKIKVRLKALSVRFKSIPEKQKTRLAICRASLLGGIKK